MVTQTTKPRVIATLAPGFSRDVLAQWLAEREDEPLSSIVAQLHIMGYDNRAIVRSFEVYLKAAQRASGFGGLTP